MVWRCYRPRKYHLCCMIFNRDYVIYTLSSLWLGLLYLIQHIILYSRDMTRSINLICIYRTKIKTDLHRIKHVKRSSIKKQTSQRDNVQRSSITVRNIKGRYIKWVLNYRFPRYRIFLAFSFRELQIQKIKITKYSRSGDKQLQRFVHTVATCFYYKNK